MGTLSPKVAIIILNWNNWRDTAECVDSCMRLSYPLTTLLVVDNGSTDDSERYLKERFPEVEILQTGSNLGFAGGSNAGIFRAMELGAKFIWLLNNDTIVPPDALTPLVESLEKIPDAGMAGSLICFHHQPDITWSAGGAWQPRRLRLRQRGAYKAAETNFSRIEEVGSISGCSLIVRAETIQTIGVLCEEFFLYWEDTDWCARVLAAGKKILFVPQSRVWHKVSASTKSYSKLQYYYYTRNGLLFCQRHDLQCLPIFLLYTFADVFRGVAVGRAEMASGFIAGILDFCKRRFGRRSDL